MTQALESRQLVCQLLVALLQVLAEADENLRVLPQQLWVVDLVERDHALIYDLLARRWPDLFRAAAMVRAAIGDDEVAVALETACCAVTGAVGGGGDGS